MDVEVYLVTPNVAAFCGDEVREVDLHLCATRNGGLFVWLIPAPSKDGKLNSWTESKREAANVARSQWMRLKSDKPNQQYRHLTPQITIPDPTWPDVSMRTILERAFGKDRLITDLDHPLLKSLRGEA
jgi:hypothetical protein